MTAQVPEDLLNGYGIFRASRFADEEDRFRSLAEGQSPKVMVIGCADSRVDPATIFAAAPGELFVVRNVAALVPPYEVEGAYHGTSAALEFAVTQLQVDHIVVLGHGLCGGITAALASSQETPVGQFIGPWVDQLKAVRETLLEQAVDVDPDGHQQALEHLSVKYSLDNLRGFPFVSDAVRTGTLALHGAWFSIAEGKLCWLDPDSGAFEDVRIPAASQ